MKTLRWLVLCAVLFGSAPGPANAQDLPALIAQVAPAIVVLSEDGMPRGSGFTVSAYGVIVTSLHVIAHMKSPRLTLADGTAFEQFSIFAYDRDRDLAVLKIPATGLPFLKFGASRQVKVGQRVVAFGTPWGLSGTTTAGIVSAIRRHHRVPGASLLQTDAAINPGNSGGPLVDARGNAVGVIVSRITSGQNLGFAVPSDELRPLLRSSEQAFTLEELRRYLLASDWAPGMLPRRWRANGDFYFGATGGSVYQLEGKEEAIRITMLRPAGESWLGAKLVLSLARNGQGYAGESSGEVNCETERASRKVPWRQKGAEIRELSFDKLEMSFVAPAFPDPQGDCSLEFRRHTVALIPVDEAEAAPATREPKYVEEMRARRASLEQRRERLRRDCVEVRAKLARDCAQATQWNASSCNTFQDLAAVCSREGF